MLAHRTQLTLYTYDELKNGVREELRYFNSFTGPAQRTRVSHKGEKSVFMIMEAVWRNNLNFIKDVPVIYVNFIILVIIVSEKKIEGITFLPPLVQHKMLSRCL